MEKRVLGDVELMREGVGMVVGLNEVMAEVGQMGERESRFGVSSSSCETPSPCCGCLCFVATVVKAVVKVGVVVVDLGV